MENNENIKLNVIELETPQNTEKFFAPPTDTLYPFLISEYGRTFKGVPCYQLRMPSHVSCLQYVISGSGIIINNGNVYSVKAGDTFLLLAGTDQIYYSNQDNQFERIWINFKGVLSEKLIEIYGLKDQVVFRNTDTFTLLSSLHEICKRNKNATEYSNETAQVFLKIVQFLSQQKTEEKKTTPVTEDIRLYIDCHIMENVTLTAICKQFYLSKEHLIRKFRQAYGITPHQYILQSKIRIAMIMLQTNQMSIEKITERLYFSDPHHFTLQFKKHTGVCPSEYRKKFIKANTTKP